ncbi:hypothetical protein [Butyrivibrio virus Arian]|nr:hypothetical protein [Butyrivibrio virus Arian]
MMDLAHSIKTELEKLEELEAATNVYECQYTRDPENEAFEQAYDNAYKAEHAQGEKVKDLIIKATKCDRKTAHSMLYGKREKLNDLCNRLA